MLRCGATGAVLLILLTGCGGAAAGGPPDRLTVTAASFPAGQRVGAGARLRLAVRNDGTATLPDVAVTVDAFAADPSTPTWLVDAAPAGGRGPGGETWSVGPLAPGATLILVWRVTPVRPGRVRLGYVVSSGGGGQRPAGSFEIMIRSTRVDTRVDPRTGRIVVRPRPDYRGSLGRMIR